MVSDYGYPYATLVLSVLSTAAVLAKNNITVGYLFNFFVRAEVGWAQKKFRTHMKQRTSETEIEYIILESDVPVYMLSH